MQSAEQQRGGKPLVPASRAYGSPGGAIEMPANPRPLLRGLVGHVVASMVQGLAPLAICERRFAATIPNSLFLLHLHQT